MPVVMSWISLGMNISPSIGPTLGGFLGEWLSWRATFWFVGGFGLVLLLVSSLGLAETNRHRSAQVDLASLLRGSGEMLRRLAGINKNGLTCGVDLSPNMAARTQRLARRGLPDSQVHCQAVDARRMPFRDH